MLEAIEDVHNKGFIHRDVKPSNFVTGKGSQKKKVYIVDFGLAKAHLDHGITNCNITNDQIFNRHPGCSETKC